MAEAVVLGRTVAPEHAGEIGRQTAREGRERRGEGLGLRRRKGEPALRGGERRRGCVPRHRRSPAGRHENRQGAERLQHRTAGGHAGHCCAPVGYSIATVTETTASLSPTVTAASSKLGGPMKPRAPLVKPWPSIGMPTMFWLSAPSPSAS